MNNKIEITVKNFIKENLSPIRRERDFITTKYNELQNFLEGRTFQNGSYARHTSTTPVSDLDVFYFLPDSIYESFIKELVKYRDLDVSNILDSLAKELRKNYPKEVSIKVQPHSVGIYFADEDSFSIDVVPAIPADDGKYWVPESSHMSILTRRTFYETGPKIKWIKSDPKGYISEASLIDDQSSGNFRKTAKFIKKWKIGCKNENSEFRLKSFHLEQIVVHIFKENIYTECLEAIDIFFTSLDRYISKPHFQDCLMAIRLNASCAR